MEIVSEEISENPVVVDIEVPVEEIQTEDEIVTEVEELDAFYEAEEYHQDYFEKNPNDAYCQMHARPKVEKVRERFERLLKAGA